MHGKCTFNISIWLVKFIRDFLFVLTPLRLGVPVRTTIRFAYDPFTIKWLVVSETNRFLHIIKILHLYCFSTTFNCIVASIEFIILTQVRVKSNTKKTFKIIIGI